MLIKKDKKSFLFTSSKSFFTFNNLFNKKFFSTILKLLGILQIILFICFLYIVIALDKEEIKVLLHSTASKVYWSGKYVKILPLKWSNNISSEHPILNLKIAPKDYQLLMLFRNDIINDDDSRTILREEHRKRVPAVVSYDNDEFDVRIRLKGDGAERHSAAVKWSMRVAINNGRFLNMKAFNLQDPKRRSYVVSFMLHKISQFENLTTKKFNLIPVSINGKYMGIYNYEEIPDHNMNMFLTGVNNIVIFIDDDDMFEEAAHVINLDTRLGVISSVGLYYNEVIKAHSLNEILGDSILKEDFENASKIYNGFRNGKLTVSEVFDEDKVAIWLAISNLGGAYHGTGRGNIKLVYDRNSKRLYPIIWDAYSENAFSAVGFNKQNMFSMDSVYLFGSDRAHPDMFIAQLFEDENFVEKYLKKLNQITEPDYIDKVMETMKPDVDEYMNVLNLDYPQFKIEDALKRLRENAQYLRDIYLYPEVPFNAYLSENDKENSLILVNRKAIPIKIIALVDITSGQQFKVKSNAKSNFILVRNIPGKPAIPIEVSFECPMKNCLNVNKINNLRVSAQVIGANKKTSVKINNWIAYE